jgi:ATP-dependent Clp protease ATP-binding subunit ClpA
MDTEEKMKEKIMEALKERFRPEFLNRLDEIIIFHPLSKEHIEKIVELQLEMVKKRLKEKNIELEVSEEAKKLIAEKGFDPVLGARPLKRVIQKEILDKLALEIVKGNVKEGDKVKVEVEKNKIVIK